MDSLVVEEEFAQTASAVSTLRAILDGYPLSVGIFRELLQNSEDAGASKQVFVLDNRNHATEGLYRNGLALTQGPALLAFNNEVLRPQDWKALCAIHDSSKAVDEFKIGKYGVGFRSVFNLTDSPQILSGDFLAIFDPLGLYLGPESKGMKTGLEGISSSFPNQLLPFDFFMKDGPASHFPGTVIRCPLRNTSSRISDQVVRGETISNLFKGFINEELEMSCLFLKNIKCIEIYEIPSTGVVTLLAKMTIFRSVPDVDSVYTATVDLTKNDITETKELHIMENNFLPDEAPSLQPDHNLNTGTCSSQGPKFSPEVKIAVDLTNAVRGRLFSYLPLPIFTGFPVHIHAPFGIDASRAHLKRASVGLMSGSQDHAKVQWNHKLFQTFIPWAWSRLLEAVASKALVSDVFSLWPPERSTGELEPYYSQLSEQFVDALVAAKAAVWPVYDPQNKLTEPKSLDTLVVASPTERECVLQALAGVEVTLTRPPEYIFELLRKSSSGTLSILDPEVAHRLLLEKVDRITQASNKDQRLLLEYLLSTRIVLNICDLPLVPVANGKKVTLSTASGVPTYTMLTNSEFEIFGECDDSTIPLRELPSVTAATLLELGPGVVNVQCLSVSRIVDYLSVYPSHLASSLPEGTMDLKAIRWLSGFWMWMNGYQHRNTLFPRIRDSLLLPSTNGLRRANSALFRLRGEHPFYTTAYRALGVPFIHGDLSEAAHGVLQGYNLVKSIREPAALLDELVSIFPGELSSRDCEGILKHLAVVLDESISQERIQPLRNLPIFPVLTCTTTGNPSSIVTNWSIIPQGHAIRSVGRPKFVPLVDGISFVGLDNLAPSLVKFLDPTHPNPMTENDLVELAAENLTTQPEHLQLALLRHITENRSRVIQDVFNKLCRQPFVLAEDGVYRVPGDIADPASAVGSLYTGCPAHLPSTSSSFCIEIVRCLRSLGLLRVRLNPEIIAERVEYISSHTSENALFVARNLLRLLGTNDVDFSRLQGISDKKWLPTNRGLCSADECRHAALTPLALFDQVLAILESFIIPHSLQNVLRWDEPLPIELLIRQLDCLLNFGRGYDAVVEVIKEFGRRQWNEEDLGLLKTTVRDRSWIPTTFDVLADVKSAVFNFSPTMINSGFYQIRTNLGAESLLQQMDCRDHPSTEAILEKLHLLRKEPNRTNLVSTSISLLQFLSDDLSDVESAELLIPDENSKLRPRSEIFYNDIGRNSCLVRSDGHFIAHPLLDEPLVSKLGLKRLGLQYVELRNIGPNLGQAPITTVRRTLEEYTDQQFLLEFLANAEDAKANVCTMALNLRTVCGKEKLSVLSPAMEYLCELPSLVVYNNAEFTEKDFDGICCTSVGGKEGRADTIGEFGLGVLTMYHFTDLAMVISGSRVLFLDPSMKHLPRIDIDRGALGLELRHVQQFYKDHLIALDGLLGFDMSAESYNGTLFVLPLRVCDDGMERPHIISKFWSPQKIMSDILEPFRKCAGDCLLFTAEIQTIGCISRAEEGAVTPKWSFRAHKTSSTDLETGYVVTNVEIIGEMNSTTRWKTVKTCCSRNQLPVEFQGKASLIRKPTFGGLAARLDGPSSTSPTGRYNFFSILPLSTPTTLPMHVMASFKLSSDRRQIRLDGLEILQRQYNTWLLEDIIPPLYLFLLENLLHSADEYYRVRWPSDGGDTVSNHIVNSFYSSKHLTSSTRSLFPSEYCPPPGRLLSPQEAVLHVTDAHDVRRIVSLLAPYQVVDLPSGPRELATERAKLPTVNPEFIKSEILRNPEVITSRNDFQIITDVILHLTNQTNQVDILCGLPILPLEDGSFGTLATRGASTKYYLWKEPTRKHNFDPARFISPRLKNINNRDKLNISDLDPFAIKDFIDKKLLMFSQLHDPSARDKWIDSFWGSWDVYSGLRLKPEHIQSLRLVPTTPTTPPVCLDQCKNGEALLVAGNSPATLEFRVCLRQLGLPVVHLDGQIPESLRTILKDYPLMNLQNLLSAIAKVTSDVPMSDTFATLDDKSRKAFADWVRKNISEISEDQISVAQTLPIWWSAGGGASPAFRPASEVQLLLPEKLTLEDAATFMADCVAEDKGLTHLGLKHMSPDDLPDRLDLPKLLDIETLRKYKRLYEKWGRLVPSACHRRLPVPTSERTLKKPEELFRRDRLFTAVFPDASGFFVHPEFEEFEKEFSAFGLQTEQNLTMEHFKTCGQSLAVIDPMVVPRAKEVFRAFSEILPNHVTGQPQTWHELDDIPFIPRRMATARKLPDLDENEPGLGIPPEVTQLDAIVRPSEILKEEFEAIAWTQRACFDEHPMAKVYIEYPDLGKPSPSEVMAHLRHLSRLRNLCGSQRRVLLHDVKQVYDYLSKRFTTPSKAKEEELAQNICLILRDEPLFLNIDDGEEALNWVPGSSLAIDCHHREGSMQGIREFLQPYEKTLEAAGVLKVYHPRYEKSDSQLPESGVWSSFDRLRQEKALTDVVFIVEPTEAVPNPEELFAHRSFLAISSGHFKDFFCQGSQDACPGCPLVVKVQYSWQCLRSLLDFVYTRNKGGKDHSLELLLEILRASDEYKVLGLFDDVQAEIIERRLVTPETVEMIKAEAEAHQAKGLLKACAMYENANKEFIKKSRVSTQIGDI